MAGRQVLPSSCFPATRAPAQTTYALLMWPRGWLSPAGLRGRARRALIRWRLSPPLGRESWCDWHGDGPRVAAYGGFGGLTWPWGRTRILAGHGW